MDGYLVYSIYMMSNDIAEAEVVLVRYNVQRMRDLFPKPRDCKIKNGELHNLVLQDTLNPVKQKII